MTTDQGSGTPDRCEALHGALVADAAALGLHWHYEPAHIRVLEAGGDLLFRQPDAAVYHGRKGYFAHRDRRAGMLSQYGEHAALVARLAFAGNWSPSTHQAAFNTHFGPGGTYVGYADRPTRALVARVLQDGEDIPEVSGSDDDQMPVLAVVPGLFAAAAPETAVLSAARVLTTNDRAIAATQCLHTCLTLLDELQIRQASTEATRRRALHEALERSAECLPDDIRDHMLEAIVHHPYDAVDRAEHYGLACHVHQGLPVAWHILAHAPDFESALRDNIRCGGDSCGRAMMIGAIAGFVHGVPKTLLDRLATGVLDGLSATDRRC